MIYLYWILGVVGYVFMGVITSLAFFYFEDSEPDGRAGTVALLWPIFFTFGVLALPFYALHKLVHYVFNRMCK